MTAVTTAPTPIVLCADDFALDARVDAAVAELSQQGRLSATSCMVTSPRWNEAAALLRELRPRLSAGLHFNLTEGHGVGPSTGVGQVIAQAYLGRWPVAAARQVWRDQLDAFEQATGTAPDFIDGHQHVHQLPGIRAALLEELATRYHGHERPWVRYTAPAGRLWREPKASIIAALGGWSLGRSLRRAAVPLNPDFGGVYGFDAATPEAYGAHMARWLAALQRASLLMCHPATAPVEGDAIGRQRAVEYAYLRSDAFGDVLTRQGWAIAQGPLTPLLQGK